MKRIRLRYYLIILLATLSLTSVGFASWLVSDSATASTNGLIVVEDVLKANDYVVCGTAIEKFKYFKTGFLDENNNIVNSGSISVPLTIYMDECNNKFAEETLEMQLSLADPSLQIFSGNGNIQFTAVVTTPSGSITPSLMVNSDSTLLTAIFDLPITSGEVNITITYTFTFNNVNELSEDAFRTEYQTYFKKNIYPYLVQADFNFSFSAKLTGKAGTN